MSLLSSARDRVARARRLAALARHPVRPGDIVLLGDSITQFGDWNEWLPDRPVRNRGVGGETSADVLRRLRHELARPAQLFLMVGTNDIGNLVPVGSTAANVAEILSTIGRRSPDTLVFVQSVLPRSRELASAIRDLNGQLAELSARAGARFVDLFPLFADEQGAIRPEYSDDALHLLPPAYVVWLDAIRHLITAG